MYLTSISSVNITVLLEERILAVEKSHHPDRSVSDSFLYLMKDNALLYQEEHIICFAL